MKFNIDLLLPIMITSGLYAEDIAVTYGGDIRLGAQYHDTKIHQGTDFAMGGNLHLDAKLSDTFSVGTTFYTSQVLLGRDDAQGVPFFTSDGSSFSLLSVAYIQARFLETKLIVGRQILDTPFADSDDIGMVPNSFEAYTLINTSLPDSTLTYSYLRRMAGVDADVVERFSEINGDTGAHLLGYTYEGIEDISLSAWFYALPHFANLYYAEGTYEGSHVDLIYRLSTQVALQEFKESKSAKIWGVCGDFGYKNMPLSLHLAYDTARGGAAINGFGGGPFFANDEHMTLADVGADGDIMVYGLEWDASQSLFEGLGIGLFGARLHDGKEHSGDEFDIVATYGYHDTLDFELIYSTLDVREISGDKFDNLRLFANYSF